MSRDKDAEKPATIDDLNHAMKDWSYEQAILNEARAFVESAQKLLAQRIAEEAVAAKRTADTEMKVRKLVTRLANGS